MLFKGWQVSQQDSLGNWGWIGEPGVKVTCFAVLNKFQFWSQKRDKQQETGEKTKEKLVNGRQETNDLFEKKDLANVTNTIFALGRAVSYHTIS